MPHSAVEAALGYVESHVERTKSRLVELVRIPSVSAEGFPREEVRRSAEATAALLREAGLENVRLVEMPGQHPYAYGDWLHAQGAPTLLVYGHHDVQPPGRPERWTTPAFEPAERDGRLYGRGTVDDKGTFVCHIAAAEAWLRAVGRLPLNVRFLIEGEEETGSEGLEPFLARHASMLAADVAVLADTGNFDVGHPALTYQLRGICQVDVEVRCLKQPVHSGFWGGPVPDAVRILTQLIAGARGEGRRARVPGLYEGVAETGKRQLRRIRALPFDEGKLPQLGRDEARHAARRREGLLVWSGCGRGRALTVIALEAQTVQGSANQVLDAARARLSLRTVPDMDAAAAGRLLVKRLTADPPAGAKVTARVTGTARWWTTDPEGPAFEAARRALASAFGREPAMIGAGGSIGFVQPFSDALGGVPCLLMGVEDPSSAIHSENESLHLGDFVKGMRAAVHLYDELARAPLARSGRRRRDEGATRRQGHGEQTTIHTARGAGTAAGPLERVTRMDDSGGGWVYRSPVPYEAARINAAAVYCSDGRIGDHMDEFLHQGLALPRYDRVACPGGPVALAGRLLAFWESRGVLEQLRFLVRVHEVRQVVLIAHGGCAYYQERLAHRPGGGGGGAARGPGAGGVRGAAHRRRRSRWPGSSRTSDGATVSYERVVRLAGDRPEAETPRRRRHRRRHSRSCSPAGRSRCGSARAPSPVAAGPPWIARRHAAARK